jgi:tetratricopeptide (TPR) repeat protein
MAKVIVTSLVVIMLTCMVGCRQPDSNASSWHGTGIKTGAVVSPAGTGETDLVEKVVTNRQTYYNALKSLEAYYQEQGNNSKLRWAKDELTKFENMPHYNYIVEAVLAPANLRPTESISEADLMFREAYRLEKDAGPLPFLKEERRLREALDLYNGIIKKFPTSDKIDEAAWQAAGIYMYFKDYSLALPYYQRVYEWNPKTTHPARLESAQILDRQYKRMDQALELYKQSLQSDTLSSVQRDGVQLRIKELTKGQ